MRVKMKKDIVHKVLNICIAVSVLQAVFCAYMNFR